MKSLLLLIDQILGLYNMIIFAAVIWQLLIAFQILNPRQKFVWDVQNFLTQITEPVLRPIRQILPRMGAVDFSPVVVLFLIGFLRNLIREYGFGVL